MGGHGAVLLEGMLANSRANLPETLYLGWLLVQVALWRPTMLSVEQRCGVSERDFLAVATLPLVLAAGQYVELAPTDPQLVRQAREAWLPDSLPVTIDDWLEAEMKSPSANWAATVESLATHWRCVMLGPP